MYTFPKDSDRVVVLLYIYVRTGFIRPWVYIYKSTEYLQSSFCKNVCRWRSALPFPRLRQLPIEVQAEQKSLDVAAALFTLTTPGRL